MPSGYDSIYLRLIPRLKECDFKENANRLGLEFIEGSVLVNFLKRKYQITVEGVEPLDGQPIDANSKSVLIYYLLSKGAGNPENSYILFESIPAMIGGLSFQNRLMSKPLEREFGNDYCKFSQAAIKLDGIAEESHLGKHTWKFDVLPKIPLKAVFYEADEDFPATVQIMLDKTATRFMEFECLAFMVGCFVRALIKAKRQSS